MFGAEQTLPKESPFVGKACGEGRSVPRVRRRGHDMSDGVRQPNQTPHSPESRDMFK